MTASWRYRWSPSVQQSLVSATLKSHGYVSTATSCDSGQRVYSSGNAQHRSPALHLGHYAYGAPAILPA